jgi:hypothetical protein
MEASVDILVAQREVIEYLWTRRQLTSIFMDKEASAYIIVDKLSSVSM